VCEVLAFEAQHSSTHASYATGQQHHPVIAITACNGITAQRSMPSTIQMSTPCYESPLLPLTSAQQTQCL
jgi:hypothetical protein